MQLQNDVSEIKASIVEGSRQVRLIEHSVATGAPGQLPAAVSRGHAILVDATGREHPMLLDQCRHLAQLDAMLSVILFQCRPDEAEIQRWYIERKQYDFVIYGTNSDVIQLTRESDIWSTMQPGTRIVMRVITEEEVDSMVTATYNCPCGTANAVNVSIRDIAAALQRGCTVTCRHCERRFQIARTQRIRYTTDNTSSRDGTDTPVAEAKYLIRNFLAKQVFQVLGSRPSVSDFQTPLRYAVKRLVQGDQVTCEA
ncbi:hypothetical protein OG21DRAFT_270471 [Imleria badia]|nr:hypothetical protein OG21DRAFT_270471 [Imleria badia]